MMETSDEEDYEEGADTDALDSDDSLPENEKVNTAVTPPSVTKPPLKTDKANLSQKRGVRFSAQLEAGPTTGGADTEHPKPILRNKDEKTPVDEKAIQAMEETEPKRSILPATDVRLFFFIVMYIFLFRLSMEYLSNVILMSLNPSPPHHSTLMQKNLYQNSKHSA